MSIVVRCVLRVACCVLLVLVCCPLLVDNRCVVSSVFVVCCLSLCSVYRMLYVVCYWLLFGVCLLVVVC